MNKNLECININWASLGAELAQLSDEEQKPFFKSFAKEMNSYPSHHQRGLQIASFASGLTDDEKEVYQDIGYKE